MKPNHGLVGLARVSLKSQDLQLQLDALEEAGCIKIFKEKVSTRATVFPGLELAKEYMRAGDVMCVWRLDRLGRNAKEILTTADDLADRDIGIRILQGRLAGSYHPKGEGKFFFTLVAALAELERDWISERTFAGLEAARKQGRHGGRPTVMDADKLAIVRARLEQGQSIRSLAKDIGVGRTTIYRHLPPRPAESEPDTGTEDAASETGHALTCDT